MERMRTYPSDGASGATTPGHWFRTTAIPPERKTMKKIFVGNLSFNTTESELRSMFQPYAAVESALIVTDRNTGRSRGFGFVEIADNGAAEQTIWGPHRKGIWGGNPTLN